LNDPLTRALTTALIAAGVALLTIVATPRLQHVFWRRQRRAELRLGVIRELNSLTSDFLARHIDDPANFKPSIEWFAAFSAVDANIRSFFSAQTYGVFK
jgi:hypothetical protein